MTSRKILLSKLLQTLVDEWGKDEVSSALARTLIAEDPKPGLEAKPNIRPSRFEDRWSATAQIERTALEGTQKQALLQLADRYDRKQFLPSVADVREFIIMLGERPIGMKDRKDAFRVLLRNLMQLPVERLERLVGTALHSGPSELGPLSDAIAAAGETLPRRIQSNTDYGQPELPSSDKRE